MSDRLRITVFTWRDLAIPGGSLIRVIGITRPLSALGCDVTLIASHCPPELAAHVQFVPPAGQAARYGLSLFYAAHPQILRPLRIMSADNALADLINATRPDVIHCHQHDGGFRLLKIRHRLRAPVVFELHGIMRLQQHDLQAAARFPGHTGLVLRAERHLFAASDALLVRTPEEQRYVVDEFGVDATRTFVVPDGADVGPEAPMAADRRRALLSSHRLDGKRVVLFGGWLKKQSGIMDLLAAFARLRSRRPDTALVIVGDGVLMPDVRSFLQAQRLGDDVVLTGFVPREIYLEWRRLADVLVTPEVASEFNALGAPLKLFDCLASGRPTVATRIASHTGIVQDEVNGFLVAPEDADSMAAGIERALTHPDAAAIGRRGREAIARDHSWEASAVQVVEAYRRVLVKPRRGL